MRDWSAEEFLTVAEIAALLQLNQQTIRNRVDQGSLPALRIGRRVRVLRSDLDQLVNSGNRDRRASSALESLEDAYGFWDGDAVTLPSLSL